MTGSGRPKFEIPTDMRKMTEQSLEQVKTEINAYLQFLKQDVPENVIGGSAPSDKIRWYAERNIASALEFAQRLAQVNNVQDIFMLQTEFMRAQIQAMAEQAKDLGETTTKALAEVPRKKPWEYSAVTKRWEHLDFDEKAERVKTELQRLRSLFVMLSSQVQETRRAAKAIEERLKEDQ